MRTLTLLEKQKKPTPKNPIKYIYIYIYIWVDLFIIGGEGAVFINRGKRLHAESLRLHIQVQQAKQTCWLLILEAWPSSDFDTQRGQQGIVCIGSSWEELHSGCNLGALSNSTRPWSGDRHAAPGKAQSMAGRGKSS